MIDEHRACSSDAVSSWARDNGISLVIFLGEAHTRLGVVERRHQLLRRAVEIYLAGHQDHTRDAVRKALDYMVPQINALPNVHGYSPAQWVLGKQPKLPGELQPGDFEDVLAQRAAAKHALADTPSCVELFCVATPATTRPWKSDRAATTGAMLGPPTSSRSYGAGLLL